MSSDIIDYSDLLIDYMDEIVKNIPNFSGLNWQPYIEENIILSDVTDGAVGSKIDTTPEISNRILSFNNLTALNAEDVYRTISELSAEHLNLFSPKIEIYRRLPSFLTVTGDGVKSNEIGNYVYKKFDFIDGSNILGDDKSRIDIDKQIFEGTRGLGLAAITDASWNLEPSADAYEQNTEKFDFLGKTTAGISSFAVNFKFDSPMTFFGNNNELVSKFMRDPVNYIQRMQETGIEGNDITRNYAYLMFLSDFTSNNNTANIDPERNNDSNHFLIKVGYSPVTYDIDQIIQDNSKKQLIKKFNSLLLNYEDYINLVFECKLSKYEFEFAKDNSLKLKCDFVGIVRQGALRDLYSNRTNDMNFMNAIYNADSFRKLQRLKQVSRLISKYNSLKGFGCDVEKTISDIRTAAEQYQTFEEIVAEFDALNDQLQQERINSLSNFLNDVNINLLIFKPNVVGGAIDLATRFVPTTAVGVTIAESVAPDYFSALQTSGISEYYDSVIQPLSSSFNPNLIAETIKKTIKYSDYISAQPLTATEMFERVTGELTSDGFGEAIPDLLQGIEQLNLIPSSLTGPSPQDTVIPFFFFGDLVDNVLKKFKRYHADTPKEVLYKNFTCFMPNITVYKRTRLFDDGTTIRMLQDGSKQKINAAFIPITMDLWRKWCHDNIIKKQRKYYHLLDLLNDLKKLLTSAINYKTQFIIDYEPILKTLGNRPLLYSSFYETKYEIEQGQFFQFLNKQRYKNLAQTGDLSVLQFLTIDNRYIRTNGDIEPVNFCGYTSEIITNNFDEIGSLIAVSEDAESSDTHILSGGNYEKDVKNKIVHFFIGNQMGLAKNFTFANNPAPRAKAIALDDETSSLGFKNINYLSVTIKLAGSNFFRPMEVIYVHPHYTFGEPFDNVFNMSNILNIGGYYVIQKISSNFTSKGAYETTIEAKYYVQAQNEAIKRKCEELLREFGDDWIGFSSRVNRVI